MNGNQILRRLWLAVQVVVTKLKLGRLKMNPATEVFKELNEANREPTLAERTHDALKEDNVLLGETVQ